MSSHLYACTKCHKKYPFKELSKSSMMCNGCQSAPVPKSSSSKICTYCREEYHRSEENVTFCSRCEQKEKQYGKPKSCQICNIIAAFIGSKCKRCVVSEQKWGSPVPCEQCKQRCAYNRTDKEKSSDRVLCWLCTVAYKRAAARAKKIEGQSADKKSQKRKSPPTEKVTSSTESPSKKPNLSLALSGSNGIPGLATTMKRSESDNRLNMLSHDTNIVVVTQLREEVESLKKTILQKEQLIIQKDRKMTGLKTAQMEMEKFYREKIENMKTTHSETVSSLRSKNADLLKQIATLSKSKKLVSLSSNGNNSRSASPLTL